MAKKYLDYNGLLYFWGKLKATFALVSHTHTKSQITDFPSTMPPSSHTHGNITNDGKLQTTDVPVANGDKLVITDSSASGVVVRSSIDFDTTTTGTDKKVLSKKGTWVDLPSGVSPYTSSPEMDGTPSAGSSPLYSRGDHVHPSDDTKVDKETGKGLSTNDFTTALKNKLDGIASGAEVNVQADWNQATTTADDYIKNKPTKVSDFTNDSGFITSSSLSGYVPNTRKVNGKALSSDITLYATDINMGSTANQTITQYLSNLELGVVWNVDKGVANGVCPLNSSTKIDSTYLPSYVDDVIEAYPISGATELLQGWLSATSGGSALTPETGKIYVLMADSTSYSADTQFRWATGSDPKYVKLADGGVTSITNGEIDTIVAS